MKQKSKTKYYIYYKAIDGEIKSHSEHNKMTFPSFVKKIVKNNGFFTTPKEFIPFHAIYSIDKFLG